MSESAGSDRGDVPTARLFCALDPDPATVELIEEWQRRQPIDEGLRAVRPEALHLTLAFLGERPEREIPPIAAALEGLGDEPAAGILGAEPMPRPARRPRLFALAVESPDAERLERELSARLQALGGYQPPSRPFWPHLTVFRLPRSVSKRARRGPAGRLEPLPIGDGHAFGFVRVALYRSQLRPEGSKYSRLAAKHLQLPRTGGRQKR